MDVRVWVLGLGTVGQWLLRALDSQAASFRRRYGFGVKLVGVGSARDGFVYDARGLDVSTLLSLRSAGRPISDHPGVRHWVDTAQGIASTEADVLVEVTASPRESGEPGFAHMREALRRGIPVVTSNKWPVALHAVELTELALQGAIPFRAESTVMSGTPVLSALVDGLAGATPRHLRGVLNATATFILGEIEAGSSYEDALRAAQDLGLAERDPSADVDGHDSMAKTMILAGLVFGEQLRPEEVMCRGIGGLDPVDVRDALSAGLRIRLVSTLGYVERGGTRSLHARVEPVALPSTDPLAGLVGVTNGVVCDADPVGEITITGPGAGLALAGQGVLSDAIAVARWCVTRRDLAGERVTLPRSV